MSARAWGRDNPERILLASATRTATVTGADELNPAGRGLRLFLDITAAAGTTKTLDVKVQWKDPISGAYLDLPGAAFAQQTAAATLMLTIYPGISETGNRDVSDVLPRVWRFVATLGGTGGPSFTYSLGASYLP